MVKPGLEVPRWHAERQLGLGQIPPAAFPRAHGCVRSSPARGSALCPCPASSTSHRGQQLPASWVSLTPKCPVPPSLTTPGFSSQNMPHAATVTSPGARDQHWVPQPKPQRMELLESSAQEGVDAQGGAGAPFQEHPLYPAGGRNSPSPARSTAQQIFIQHCSPASQGPTRTPGHVQGHSHAPEDVPDEE